MAFMFCWKHDGTNLTILLAVGVCTKYIHSTKYYICSTSAKRSAKEVHSVHSTYYLEMLGPLSQKNVILQEYLGDIRDIPALIDLDYPAVEEPQTRTVWTCSEPLQRHLTRLMCNTCQILMPVRCTSIPIFSLAWTYQYIFLAYLYTHLTSVPFCLFYSKIHHF